MKKILYLITSSEYGGAQKYVRDLAVNLPPTNYQAIVAAGQGDGELLNQLADFPAVKTVKIFNLKRLPNPLTAQKCLKEIVQLLLQEKPDVLHLNSSMAGFLGSWAAKIYQKKTKANLKVVYTVHGWVFLEPGFGKSLIYFLVEKISAKYKDLFIVLSERDLQIGLRKKIAPKNKFVKIYNGLNCQSINFLTKEQARQQILPPADSETTKPVISTIANFYATKGLTYLLEAASILRQRDQNFFLVIIGDGPQRKKLEKLIVKLNLADYVFLAGRIPQASKYLKAFDIFVLPSVKEGFPFVILEAMAAQRPIIATTVGAIPEIIENNQSGILVKPKSSTALASVIENLLNNSEQQKSLAENAKQQLEKFSLNQMLDQTYSLY
ncbi:MAG: glycosyltransferase family 4 protein [Candidatus Gribaldobacteria bacterium]|nr:glycosyltransferase family 4 protein [Candidatus Gribaldobacteria bacterium]